MMQYNTTNNSLLLMIIMGEEKEWELILQRYANWIISKIFKNHPANIYL